MNPMRKSNFILFFRRTVVLPAMTPTGTGPLQDARKTAHHRYYIHMYM